MAKIYSAASYFPEVKKMLPMCSKREMMCFMASLGCKTSELFLTIVGCISVGFVIKIKATRDNSLFFFGE